MTFRFPRSRALAALLTLSLLLAAPLGRAQDTPEPAEQPAAPAPMPAMNPFSGLLGAELGFRRVEAEQISGTTAGDVTLVGQVDFRSTQIDVRCDRLEMTSDTQTIVATGTPVHIRQGAIRAECLSFTYDPATRTSTLEGDAVILQESEGRTARTEGDVIVITEDADGNIAFSIAKQPGSARLSTIEIIDNGAGGEDDSGATTGAQRLDDSNLDQIPIN